ncbi:MAG: hypoxanthine phosphoribosyltransferase [Agarilytica sp.]
MEKHFLSANQLLLDSYALAKQIFLDGYTPDMIIGVWRGGTPVAIAVQEFLEYKGLNAEHCAIKTSSYEGIDQQNKRVVVSGLEHIFEQKKAIERLLIIDDVFDSGRSVQAIINALTKETRGKTEHETKIACPWYKPSHNRTKIVPDYFCHTTDKWLVFPHELMHLSDDELSQGKGEEIATLLDLKR